MSGRKGLTPIIALVIILMLVIAAGGMLFLFGTKTQSSMQEQVQRETFVMKERNSMRVSIANIYNESGKIGVIIKNVGTVAFNVTPYVSVFYNGQPVSYTSLNSPEYPCNDFQPYKLCKLKLSVDFPAQGTFEIKVEAPGNSDMSTCKVVDGKCLS